MQEQNNYEASKPKVKTVSSEVVLYKFAFTITKNLYPQITLPWNTVESRSVYIVTKTELVINNINNTIKR